MTSGTDTTLTTPGNDTARELRRPRDGRMVAGVAAGLAEYFGMRPVIYRIAFAALAFVGGAGLLLYVVCALVIPAEDAQESIAEEFLRRYRDRPVMLIGLGVVGVLVVSLVTVNANDWGWPLAGPLGLLLLLGVAGVALWQVSERDRDAPAGPAATERRPRPRSLFLPGLGVLLAAAGVAALLELLDVVELRLDVLLAVGIVLAGVLIAVGALVRPATGLVPLGILLALGVAGTALADLGTGGPIGDRRYVPVAAAELRDDYEVRIGELELDLRRLELPPGVTRIDANVGIGRLAVLVPEDVAVDVSADAHVGDVTVLGHHDDGWGPDARVIESGARLVIDAEVGIGEVDVRRGG